MAPVLHTPLVSENSLPISIGMTNLSSPKEGLKSNVCNKLIGAFATPPTFDAYVKRAIEIDNELYEEDLLTKAQSRTHSSTPRHHSTHFTAALPASHSNIVLMEVDAVKF
ncbi:hypothetical protein BDW22DRAFT_1432834 [Trametopsis cervina]|nr:hypothetical protein BDW22DRAFT_1432834 [Trametopsis cervina]